MIKRLVKSMIVFDVVAVAAAAVARLLIRSDGDADSDEFTRVAILGGDKFLSRAAALRRGVVAAVMGGVNVDLGEAHLAAGAEITVFALWGGVAIRLPDKWNVAGDARALMGDARFALDGQDDLSPDAPTVVVNARSIMGGILVTNREHRAELGERG